MSDELSELLAERQEIAETSDRDLIESMAVMMRNMNGKVNDLHNKIYRNGLLRETAMNSAFRRWSLRAYISIASIIFTTGAYFLIEKIVR